MDNALTLKDVKVNFITAMKRARQVIQTTQWCCEIHAEFAMAIVDAHSAGKKLAFADYKANLLTEDAFKQIIMESVDILNTFIDGIESAFLTHDLPEGVRFNARSPKEIQ